MSDSRIEIEGQKEFVPREWLRRELLWATVKVPYTAQVGSWVDGTVRYIHSSNAGRRYDFASKGKDLQYQSNAFFNQGKNVTGFLAAIALFNALKTSSLEGHSINLLEIHASTIDESIANLPKADLIRPKRNEEDHAYQVCRHLLSGVNADPDNFVNNKRLLRARKTISKLAVDELYDWVLESKQNDTGSLDRLVIPDGGTARSEGAYIDNLHLLFDSIVSSDEYLSLSSI